MGHRPPGPPVAREAGLPLPERLAARQQVEVGAALSARPHVKQHLARAGARIVHLSALDARRELAHKLRGAASNLGLEGLRAQAGGLEQDLLGAAPDLRLPDRARALQQTYHDTVEALRATLARLAEGRS